MTLIAKVTLHVRVNHEATDQLTLAAATDGAGEILRSEDMRLSSDKSTLIDWTSTDATAAVIPAKEQSTTAEFLVPLELYLNIPCARTRTAQYQAALDGLRKVFDHHLHNPQQNHESCLISYTLFDAREALRFDDRYEEGDAWAFPEYRAAFLENYSGKVTVELEQFIEDQFLSGQMTAQKAARTWLTKH